MLGGVRMLGIPVTPRESRGVMQLFRYAGWLMGVDERWLVETEREGLVRLYHAVLTQGQPDWTTQELARAGKRAARSSLSGVRALALSLRLRAASQPEPIFSRRGQAVRARAPASVPLVSDRDVRATVHRV